MKRYIIGFLLVLILLLSSFVYKLNYKLTYGKVLQEFPIHKKNNKPVDEFETPPLYLYLVFTKKNCYDCLRVIDVLNNLQKPFIVTGIVPKSDLKDEMVLRDDTGATFKLIEYNKEFGKYNNNYAPTLYGVGQNGNIYFILPGVPNEKDYLKQFLESFYYKAISLLKRN